MITTAAAGKTHAGVRPLAHPVDVTARLSVAGEGPLPAYKTTRAARFFQALVMTTGVPISTCVNSHSASGMCIRMQPCDAE